MNIPIFLVLPQNAAHKSARSLVMALGLIPESVADDAQVVLNLQTQLGRHPQSAALVDLGGLHSGFKHLLDLAQKLSADARRRVIVFRHEQGPVWAADQVWARDLGFAGLFAEIDASSVLAENAALPNLLSQITGCEIVSTQRLSQYFAALQVKPDPLSLRGLIRAQCHRDAESLAQIMASGVKAVDRSYQLSLYPSCFLGTDAVQWLRSQYQCSTQIATQIGQALLNLGLLHHVLHEHDFENKEYFYRLDATASTSLTHLGRLLKELQSEDGLEVKDRSYFGKQYAQCWVAKDAVDWLSIKRHLPRHEAENLLNRLLSYGLVEHVTQAHRMKDANLFFRFR